jgi:protein-tyrosine phosphatase
MGCKLQASTDFIAGGRFGAEKKPAKKLLKAGLYSYFASDAHCVKHYTYYEKAMKEYGDLLRG